MQNYVSLNLNKDFQRLYYRGKSVAKPALVVYATKNRAGICRIGITTGKKIGNAVERNRSRRIIRAAFQSVLKSGRINGNWDIVFVARTRTKFQKSTQIERAMLAAFSELKITEEKE
ncbi:MAG: ribonuclease P protein component [Clostridia bacterium]|nr:ribonuclease P protein component [Clostridia bacterium]